jgi:hypothetical protein
MLEQMFIEQVRDVDGTKKGNSSKSKKRKAGSSGTPGTIDADDDDEPYYAKGKKAKGGVGYAGNTREDVRWQ